MFFCKFMPIQHKSLSFVFMYCAVHTTFWGIECFQICGPESGIVWRKEKFFPLYPISNVRNIPYIELDFMDALHAAVAAKSLEPKWNILTNCCKGMYRFQESLSACRDYWNERIIMDYKLLEALRQNTQTDGKWCAHERNIGKFPPRERAKILVKESTKRTFGIDLTLPTRPFVLYCMPRALSLYLCPGCIMLTVLWVGSQRSSWITLETFLSANLFLAPRVSSIFADDIIFNFQPPTSNFFVFCLQFHGLPTLGEDEIALERKKGYLQTVQKPFSDYFWRSLVGCFYVQHFASIGKRNQKNSSTFSCKKTVPITENITGFTI
jgi:hypothetical protein